MPHSCCLGAVHQDLSPVTMLLIERTLKLIQLLFLALYCHNSDDDFTSRVLICFLMTNSPTYSELVALIYKLSFAIRQLYLTVCNVCDPRMLTL